MNQLDCHEYEALQQRAFQAYSLGHRIMYKTPLVLLNGGKYSIIEAGFGIGWGLDQMMAMDVVEKYIGFEPDHDSFVYVQGRYKNDSRLKLIEDKFSPIEETFDHAFCIEVIEHVAPENHQMFLNGLKQVTKGTLWFSTPNIGKSEHGVRNVGDWSNLIKTAGFSAVTIHQEQWTTLYICQ